MASNRGLDLKRTWGGHGKRKRLRRLGLLASLSLVVGLVASGPLAVTASADPAPQNVNPSGTADSNSAIINNGVVRLGVQDEGHLNVDGGPPSGQVGTTVVGVRYIPTEHEGTSPGCLCEGWGVADASDGTTGYANISQDGVVNLDLVSFTSTATTAVSVVEVDGKIRVTQNYHPSAATPNLYEDTVTIENIGASPIGDLRYRRVMDWDIEPTAFDEFVTIDTGTSTDLLYSSDNGFETANPLGSRSSLLFEGEAEDSGPSDHGALFDFGFGSLAAGETQVFNIYYGAGGDEISAEGALAAVSAEVFSLGQPNTDGGPTLGTPNTHIFGFAGVGGGSIFTEGEPGSAECSDGIDNDNDGDTDLEDSDCQEPEGPPGDPTCSDGVDNDGDGLIDGDDPECQSAPDEEGPPGDPTCSDGIDNDGDGDIDGDDSDCQLPPDEEGPPGDPTCSDGIDNDGDGDIDEDDSDCQLPEPTDKDKCRGQQATIVGTNGDDVIIGTAGDDVIKAKGGDDMVDGLGGDDTICGGTGNDHLLGRGGRDFLFGDGGSDTLDGGDGNDKLNGSRGNDTLQGAGGADLIRGGAGNDVVHINGGADEVYGGAGDDVLDTDGGADYIEGGPGDDDINAGDGNDIVFGNRGNDAIDGSTGTDKCNGGQGTDTAVRCETTTNVP